MEQRLTPSPAPKSLLYNPNQPMKNLQNFVLMLAQAHPNAPLPPPAETLLRDRLDCFVSDYRTPEHPPYSAMIEIALQELNEKTGSTKKSISQYLEKKYDNLPWAHSALLKHHLEKACKKGEIRVTRSKKYQVAGSLNSSPKVKRKSPQKKWIWECKRQKHHHLKIRLIKKRNNQRGAVVEPVEKHQVCDEKVQPLTENGVHGEHNQDQAKSLLSCVGENKCSEEVSSQQQNDPSEIGKADISAAHTPEHQEREQSEHEQPEPSTPERPPGFESVIVENLHQLGSTEPEPDVVEVLNSNEQSKLPAMLQNGHVFEPYMTVDSTELALSTEQEPKELLQQLPSHKEEIFQGKQLRRSLRNHPAKPQLAQDANVIAALPVTVCRRKGMSLTQRPRSRPPPKPMKAASMDKSQGSPESQKQRMQLRQKPVKNLKVVDDRREQELEQSRKVSECASMHEKMEVLLPDNSQPHVQKARKKQRLGRLPQRRSARLLK